MSTAPPTNNASETEAYLVTGSTPVGNGYRSVDGRFTLSLNLAELFRRRDDAEAVARLWMKTPNPVNLDISSIRTVKVSIEPASAEVVRYGLSGQ